MFNTNYTLDPMAWIEETDIFNSGMCRKLRDIPKLKYTVRVDCDRIDLICEQIYGNANKQLISLLILLNNKTEFKADETVYYINTESLRFV